ncbi:hypothetical protein QLL95_gp0263 [Cotonvirus japonicus]|uniref:DUF5894 domain-containing protein n=1 Tax=Cotonvirus japonicus TaxID=2811091 RepID=A0ABM7NRG0_9VIRU|nr:hypothetical protein QLL95_gp0263 [Cotonvirus japonicus]BCS82752.1 hypothetical protein [Cotonvirus japonicus]
MENILINDKHLSDECGMSWYLKQIKEEIVQKQINTIAQENNMFHILENNIPTDDKLLLVNVKSGRERSAIHEWAFNHNFRHCSIRSNFFEPTFIFKCDECKKSHYEIEMRNQTDWSTISPGISLGTVLKCPKFCDGYYIDDDSNNGLKKSIAFNAILIGKSLPLLASPEVNKKRTCPFSCEKSKNMLENMIVRNIKIIKHSEFSGDFIYKGKSYPRIIYKF